MSEVLRSGITMLRSAPTDSPRLDAELILAHSLGKSSIQLVTAANEGVPNAARDVFFAAIGRRVKGEPVAYLIGSKEFYGRPFKVNSSVLIPRPDTEVLVETALNAFPTKKNDPIWVLDLGVGSGAIGLTIAAERPSWQVECWDISAPALVVAEANSKSFGLKNVDFRLCDAFNPESWVGAKHRTQGGAHLICSNPPYISNDERPGVARGVTDYEPEVALFCPTGLEFYKTISYLGRDLIAPGGSVICEIGWTQAIDVVGIFRDQEWEQVAVVKDLAGRDRVVVATAPLQ